MEEYSRMDLMRMTDEDLRNLLKEEGEKLPTFTVLMIVEELKRREETPQSAYEEFGGDMNEADDGIKDNADDAEEDETEQEPEEAANDADLSPEERLQKDIETVEKLKKERTKMLVIASVAAVLAAILIIGFMLYLYFSGQL